MASSRKRTMSSNYFTDKRVSQWEELMRKFSDAHKEQFKTFSLDIPRVVRSTKFFPTGSKYEGSWDVLGMSGYGVYTFPSGVVYEGNFEDGMFHGKGLLRYENGVVVRGKFVKGVLTEKTLQNDKMEYSEDDWNYCTMPDRRFDTEYETGLKPGGNANLTAEQPTREIPPGNYDTGDGFYDPKTKVIYKDAEMTGILRSPTMLEQQWIVKNCRINPLNPLGPCPDLYEEFIDPAPKAEPPPPPAAGVKGVITSLRTQSTYEDSENFKVSPCYSSEESPTRKGSVLERSSISLFKLAETTSTFTQLDCFKWLKINRQSLDSVLTIDQSDAAIHSRDKLQTRMLSTPCASNAELISELAAEVTFSKHKVSDHYENKKGFRYKS